MGRGDTLATAFAWGISISLRIPVERWGFGCTSLPWMPGARKEGMEDPSDKLVCSGSGNMAVPCVEWGWTLVTSARVSAGVGTGWEGSTGPGSALSGDSRPPENTSGDSRASARAFTNCLVALAKARRREPSFGGENPSLAVVYLPDWRCVASSPEGV